MKVVLSIAFISIFNFLNAQDGVKSNFKGYQELKNDSYLKYLKKGKGTAVSETGGALFIKLLFLTEGDSVFIDINKETQEPSYPMRIDSGAYAGDFLDVFSRLHVGDSVKLFMSLDSLKKYYPDEFVFEEPYNSMKYIGMAVKVDSMYTLEKTQQLQAQAVAEREKERQRIRDTDSTLLHDYCVANNFSLTPDHHGIWLRELVKGSGDSLRHGDSVITRIRKRFPETIFGEVEDFTYLYGYDELIEGWTIASPWMQGGGKYLLIIPSELAYSDGHTMIFEVEIVSLKRE